CKSGQLVEPDSRAEVWRGEIEQSVSDQKLQLWIERQNLPQVGGGLDRIHSAPIIPGDRAVQETVRSVGTPFEHVPGQIDHCARQRRDQVVARWIVEMTVA